MRILFYHNTREREVSLANAFVDGVNIFAHQALSLPLHTQTEVDADVGVFVGVKSLASALFKKYVEAGKHVILMDKGHFSRGAYYRVSINSFIPNEYITNVAYPEDRLRHLNLTIKHMRRIRNGYVLLAGSSDKYAKLLGLVGATEYAKKVVEDIRAVTDMPIVYRPKPSWKEAVPIEGTRLSGPSSLFTSEVQGADALITHGSGAATEALVEGVLTIVLGDAPVKPLVSTSLEGLLNPRMPSIEERFNWFSKLAYCQWTLPEFRSGKAWETIGAQLVQASDYAGTFSVK